MKLINSFAQLRSARKLAVYACLTAALLLQGGNRLATQETQLVSHRITISRHGSSREFCTTRESLANEQDGAPLFHYKVQDPTGGTLQAVIKNEEGAVDCHVYARLKEGDAVSIIASGVPINSMINVETAKTFGQTASKLAT